jgi:hypothetical protein
MSDDDKKTYRQLMLIATLAVFAILFLFAIGALFGAYGCFDLYIKKITPIPEGCSNGSIQKFALEFLGIVVGVLGAIRLFGQS